VDDKCSRHKVGVENVGAWGKRTGRGEYKAKYVKIPTVREGLMIRAVCGVNGVPTFESTVRGFPIYLDNFAIKSLAKGDGSLRRRFVGLFHDGADLLFSIANGVEISGAQGASASTIKDFLDELGPHWYPVDFNPYKVMEHEKAGVDPGGCCLADDLLRAYFANRTCEHLPGSGKVIDLSPEFFRLGPFVDWLCPERDHFLERSRAFDAELRTSVDKLRAKHKHSAGWLDHVLPLMPFSPRGAATFSFTCLMRGLISDSGFQVKKGDGMDFCHAVMASSFATFAALDRQWKRRVENFPKPNRAARVYYEPELQAMVTDIELALGQSKALAAR